VQWIDLIPLNDKKILPSMETYFGKICEEFCRKKVICPMLIQGGPYFFRVAHHIKNYSTRRNAIWAGSTRAPNNNSNSLEKPLSLISLFDTTASLVVTHWGTTMPYAPPEPLFRA
jgi:hypothetical protein